MTLKINLDYKYHFGEKADYYTLDGDDDAELQRR